MKILPISGHGFVNLTYHSKEAIKLTINTEFAVLCSEQLPVIANLSSDDPHSESNNI